MKSKTPKQEGYVHGYPPTKDLPGLGSLPSKRVSFIGTSTANSPRVILELAAPKIVAQKAKAHKALFIGVNNAMSLK